MDKKFETLKNNFDDIEVPAELDLVIEAAIKKGKAHKKIYLFRPLMVTAACLCIAIVSFATYVNMSKVKQGNPYKVANAMPATKESNSPKAVTNTPTVKESNPPKVVTNSPVVNESDPNKVANNISTASESNSSEVASNRPSVSESNFSKVSSNIKLDKEVELPKVNSYDNLQVLLKNYNHEISTTSNGDTMKSTQANVSGADESSITSKNNPDYSDTNQQVKGVDEGDNVKTDGNYIYKLSGNKVIITKAIPADKMEITSQITLDDKNHGSELLLKDNYLIVIGGTGDIRIMSKVAEVGVKPFKPVTQISIYDISDKQNPSKIRTIETDGGFSQARMINSSVYVVANKYINFTDGKVIDELPGYRDSINGNKETIIDYKNIGYCVNAIQPNYIMVSSFDLKDIKAEANVNVILGSGNNIYASEKNLYIAGDSIKDDGSFEDKTTIYKFALKDGKNSFLSSGSVQGSILNQFSMDESNGYFRVTTTENQNDIDKMTNDLFVLDEQMKQVGEIGGLAPKEKIYSTRFVGDRAYMVTFMQTDPLFVIDIKNPKAPSVLGELKIPGFSNYLEPYDDNHLIGFGQDTVDVSENGQILARPIGLKMAMFDVTDVSKPVEQYQIKIQGENSNSNVLYDHKALLFSKEKNLIAFPVQYNIDQNNSFEGAYVYNIDLTSGFKFKGSITHKGDNNWQPPIDRELYIGDNLYTISNNKIQANAISDLKELSQIKMSTENP